MQSNSLTQLLRASSWSCTYQEDLLLSQVLSVHIFYCKTPESCFHQDYMLMFHVLSLQLFTNLAALAFIKIIYMLICKVLSLHSFTNLPALVFIKIKFQCLSFFLYSFFHTSFMPHTDQELFSMTIDSLKELL